MPDDYKTLILLAKASWVVFVFAFGACIGSLINVLVYRLPRGLGVVSPPSRCPACSTRLTWRENIPIFGWIFLRGRCRFCSNRISPEYPIVEASVALLFVAFFALWYLVPNSDATFLGIDWSAVKPEWARSDVFFDWPRETWPIFLVLLTLLSMLVAMTIVDAKTFTIPLELPWTATVAGLAIHPIAAAWLDHSRGGLRSHAPGWDWAIPTHGWPWILSAIGGLLGIALSILMVNLGVIRRSFADYDEWEHQVRPEAPPNSSDPTVGAPDLWIQYPYARREMCKELVFLSAPITLAYAGHRLGLSMAENSSEPALWLKVAGGAIMGYLIGGLVVWAIRIFGSLAFGKEAMGLGDVHLMAGVGACLGWIDATLAFFGAAFVGLAWAVIARLFAGKVNRAMPYGPYLAVSTMLVLLMKPLIEKGLTALLHVPAGDPPINIP